MDFFFLLLFLFSDFLGFDDARWADIITPRWDAASLAELLGHLSCTLPQSVTGNAIFELAILLAGRFPLPKADEDSCARIYWEPSFRASAEASCIERYIFKRPWETVLEGFGGQAKGGWVPRIRLNSRNWSDLVSRAFEPYITGERCKDSVTHQETSPLEP